MSILAVIGVQALYLLFVWMASAIVASVLSGEKGFGERTGLASGLILSPLGPLIWLIWPAKAESDWRTRGPSPAARAAVALMLVVGLAALVYGVYSFVADNDVTAGLRVALVVYGLAATVAAGLAFATAPKRKPSEPVPA